MISLRPATPRPRDIEPPREGSNAYGADGQPGVPLVTPSPHGTRGIPAGTGTGSPIQPETRYDGMVDDEREGAF